MTDYIKRDDALSLVHHSKFDTEDDKNYIMLLLGKEYGCQSADVEPVVRCKDCEHRYITGSTTHYYVCDFMDAEYNDNGYCHHGERKDDDN